MLRKARGWLIAAAVVAAAWLVVQLVFLRTPPVDVRVVRLERGRVEDTVASTKAGSIRSRFVADVSVETAGLITAIHAREGAAVRAGDHLVSIDRRDADAALSAAQRERAVAEGLLAEARARERDAVRERNRLEALRPTGTITESQLDQAATAADVAAAAAQAAEAQGEARKAAVERARIAAEKCDLHAPFDGVVAELYVERGEWAVPGKVAMRLIDPERLYVRAELDEVDLAALKLGQPARVTLDPYKDRRFVGRIVRIAPYVSELQEQNRTVEVEIELADHQGLVLKHGTSADIEVILQERSGVPRLPTLVLMEGNRVLVVGADGRARAVPVKIGLRNWEYAEVQGGLAEGDRVISSLESEAVKEGVAVRVVEP